jgi:phage internal scaffolding protein
MKYKIQLQEGQTIDDVKNQHIKNVNSKTKPEEPGQLCIMQGDKCVKVLTITGQENRVDQSYGANLEINSMLARADKANLLKHSVKFEGEYDDIPHLDYQTAMNQVAQANSMYEALPASYRKDFKNAGEFLQFVQNPENSEKMRKMGILKGLDGVTAAGDNTGHNPAADLAAQEAAKQAADAAKEITE